MSSIDAVKKVISGDGLFLRQNGHGELYASKTKSWWSKDAVLTFIDNGFSGRELPDIFKNDEEEVVMYFDYLFNRYGNNGVK